MAGELRGRVVEDAATARELASIVTLLPRAGVIGTGALASVLPMHDPAAYLVSTRSMARVIDHRPTDEVVTVQAGCRVGDLDRLLARHGQECALDPWWPDATVGGAVAAGLNGHRRPLGRTLRDAVLGVEAVTGDGDVVRAGGRTVKNVTGYDIPRLLVGSLGRLAVLTEVTLRCRPRPAAAAWFAVDGGVASPFATAHLRHAGTDLLRFEGESEDLAAYARAVAGKPAAPGVVAAASAVASAASRGAPAARASLPPERLAEVVAGLSSMVTWTAEPLVGLLHLAAEDVDALTAALVEVRRRGGRALRYGGSRSDLLDATRPTDAALDARVAQAFDATGRLDWRSW